MDKDMFKSYKFKPSDVIEGLNRYFAESKAFRYRRVPLKIKECGCGYIICDPEEVVGIAINWLREEHDIFYTPGMNEPPIKDPDDIDDFCVDEAAKEYEKATRKDKVKYYSEKDLREALGIAEDSDIFECIKYRNRQLEILRTEVAAARRTYHKAIIKERNQFGKRLADIRKAAGMADNDPSDLVKYVETLREKADENSVLRGNVDYFANLAQGRQKALSNLRYEILKVYREIFDCSNGDPEGTDEETMNDILTEYQRVLKMKDDAETDNTKWRPYITDILGMDKYSDWSDICIRARVIRHDRDDLDLCLKMLEKHIKEAYSEVFQADADKHWFGHGCQAVTDIVEALKRERAIKEEAEEKTIKYKELARGNEETAKENKVQWNNTKEQLQWAQKENLEWVKRYEQLKSELNEMKTLYCGAAVGNGGLCEDLAKEKEKVRRTEQKLAEIKDICER